MPRNIFLTLLAVLSFASFAKAESTKSLEFGSLKPGYYTVSRKEVTQIFFSDVVDVKSELKKGSQGWQLYAIDGFRKERDPISLNDNELYFVVYERNIKLLNPVIFKLGELEEDKFSGLWRLKTSNDIPLSYEPVKGMIGEMYVFLPLQKLEVGKRYVLYVDGSIRPIEAIVEWDKNWIAGAYYFTITAGIKETTSAQK